MTAGEILQLGELDGPVLVFGGPYSNLAATRALLSKAEMLGIAPANLICTGDVVAYGAEAEQTCRLMMESGTAVVMGNCEESLANGRDNCGCGFEPDMACSVLSQNWYRYASSVISARSRNWMSTLPHAIEFSMGGYRFRAVHGSVSKINRFIYASTDRLVKTEEMRLANCDIIVGGHCGLPFGETIGEGAWLNAGVIGLPANEGLTSVWYMLLKTTPTGVACSWHRLEYDHQQSYRNMLAAGLEDYAQTLVNGLWPSMDSLPDRERANQGKALNVSPLHMERRS